MQNVAFAIEQRAHPQHGWLVLRRSHAGRSHDASHKRKNSFHTIFTPYYCHLRITLDRRMAVRMLFPIRQARRSLVVLTVDQVGIYSLGSAHRAVPHDPCRRAPQMKDNFMAALLH